MAAAKIEAMWDYDMHDNSILVLEKKRGKLSLSEVGDFLRYEKHGSLQGDYVLIIRAGEATCGGSGWMDEVEPKGDQWVLYQVEERERCPVCSNLTPYYLYCPECGATLNREKTGQQEPIDRKIELIKRMQAEMDHRAEVEEKAVELIAEGRHGEAVALLNSLDDSVIARMQEEFEEIEKGGEHGKEKAQL